MILKSILAGEFAANEFRKQFTQSERVAIAEAIEAEELQKHQGKKLVPHSAQDEGVKTRDLIAKRAGLGGHTTMAQAKRVVERGAPEVIAAMDKGEVSISASRASENETSQQALACFVRM